MLLLSMGSPQRDLSLSGAARDAALASILADHPLLPTPTLAAAAAMLQALPAGVRIAPAPVRSVLSEGESGLLTEWLDRLSQTRTPHGRQAALQRIPHFSTARRALLLAPHLPGVRLVFALQPFPMLKPIGDNADWLDR